MPQHFVYGLMAVLALVPASVAAYGRIGAGRPVRPGGLFWGLLVLAAAGPVVWSLVQLGGIWRTGLSATLWVSIASCMVLFLALCAATASAWRLSPLLLPYLAALGVLALLTAGSGGTVLRPSAPWIWVDLHIAVSVVTYALLTLGAVAALAAFLQDRALRTKRPTSLSRALPSLADAERLQMWLLSASAVVLGVGLVTGIAVQYLGTGRVIAIDHKVLFSFAAFAAIAGLVAAHAVSGVRGRRAARIALLAYLLLTLGYPGVKFVTGVLIG